jgi:deferrochelatase/peroxidase EfeB
MPSCQSAILPEPQASAPFLILCARDRASSARTLAHAAASAPALARKVDALDARAKLVSAVALGPDLWDAVSPGARPAKLRRFRAAEVALAGREELSDEEQEGITGRRGRDSVELSDAKKPPTAHIARAVIEENGAELHDRLMEFTRAVSGANFFAPSLSALRALAPS